MTKWSEVISQAIDDAAERVADGNVNALAGMLNRAPEGFYRLKKGKARVGWSLVEDLIKLAGYTGEKAHQVRITYARHSLASQWRGITITRLLDRIRPCVSADAFRELEDGIIQDCKTSAEDRDAEQRCRPGSP